MIISPPFLPSRPGHDLDSADVGDTLVPDHDICGAGMRECASGNGAYPVSYSLGWHGGAHLIAPSASNGQGEPVRAIADGNVVYILRIADEGITTATLRKMPVLVNGGGNGYDDRQQYAAFLVRYRGESTETSENATLTYSRQRIVTRTHQSPIWAESAQTSQVYVDYTPQRST
jgi:hypothetical protein